MPVKVATLTAELVADATGAKKGSAEGVTALGGWIKAQKEATKAAEELRGAIKKSMAAETVTASAANLSGVLKGLGSDFASLAGDAIGGLAHIAQGLAQGGLLGGAISGLTFTIGTIAQAWGETERAALAARDVQLDAIAALAKETEKWTAQLVATNNELRVLKGLKPGANVEAAMAGMTAKGAATKRAEAEGTLLSTRSQMEGLKATLSLFEKNIRENPGRRAIPGANALEERYGSRSDLEAKYREMGLLIATQEEAVESARMMEKAAAAREQLVVGKEKFEKVGAAVSKATTAAAAPRLDATYALAVAKQQAEIAAFAQRNAGGDGAADFAARRVRESAEAFADHSAVLNRDAQAWHAHIQGIADADRVQRDATAAMMDWQETLESAGDSFGSTDMGKLLEGLTTGSTGGVFDDTGYYAQQAAGGAAASAGGGVGMIAGAVAGGPAGLAMMGVQLLAGSTAFQAIQKDVGAALAAVGEALGAFLEPLGPLVNVFTEVVEVVAKSLAPMLRILAPILGPITEALRLWGAVIAANMEVYAYLGEYIMHVADIFKHAAMWVSDFFSDNDAERAALAAQIDAFDPGDLTDRMGEAFDEFMSDTAAGALDDVAAAAERVAGALNAPAFYRVANAVMGADRGRFVSGDGTAQDTQAMTNGAGTRGSVHPGTVSMAGGGGVSFNGPVTIIANDPRALFEALRRMAMMNNGSPVFP